MTSTRPPRVSSTCHIATITDLFNAVTKENHVRLMHDISQALHGFAGLKAENPGKVLEVGEVVWQDDEKSDSTKWTIYDATDPYYADVSSLESWMKGSKKAIVHMIVKKHGHGECRIDFEAI